MRRLLSSWSVLMLSLLVLVGGVALARQHLQHQAEVRAGLGAVDTAHVIAALVVHRNLDADDFAQGDLTPAKRADMDADVAELFRQGRLAGLKVWHADGHLIYADSERPQADTQLSPAGLRRSHAGEPWVEAGPKSVRGRGTLDVFLPVDAGAEGGRGGLVEALIPEDRIADQVRRSTRQLNALAVVVLLAMIGILALLRRRLLSREYEALHDPLTGLLNRGALAERTRQAVAAAQATEGRWAALLILDLDGFKAVNDTLGHPAGDVLLTQLAHTLRGSVRPHDVVARLGGDEFAVLLTRLPDAGQAETVARHLLDRLRECSYTVHGVQLSVDASVGIAIIPTDGRDTDQLVQRADIAMYQAKRAGAGVATYDEATDPHDVSQLVLLVDLRRAIEAGELVLHYQPKLQLATGELVGVEALVRWAHPTRGLLAPATFIPVAEHTGLMAPLTERVLQQAIRQAAYWRDRGLTVPVAVNVSPRSLLHGDLPGTVLRLLAEARVPSALLELEITETAIMTDPDRVVHVLRQLHAMGIRVAIDDFGAGYTSLAYLKQLPVHTLKIDRAFIADILEDEKDEAITESVIVLGHKLGLSVLAEGIETPAVQRRLRDLGCDEGQGHHLGPPMPATDLTAWMRQYAAAERASDPVDDGLITA
ncbi:MAG: hypothetical protein QOI54_1295 [Actinomycetota bacterium]|nr:hypothetical protein [Actinomycetota bacterium]